MIAACRSWSSRSPASDCGTAERPDLEAPTGRDVLLDVRACGVCRTDLHILDGEVTPPSYPVVPGHQIVGTVRRGRARGGRRAGARVGVPWLGWTDGDVPVLRSGRENLCDAARFTGWTATAATPSRRSPTRASAPAARAATPTSGRAAAVRRADRLPRPTASPATRERLGLYGFGAAAHLIAQVARWEGKRVFAFTSPGDAETQAFARSLGAEWAGGSDAAPPEPLDAAIIFAPVGPLVPAALRALDRGGMVVCAGIHMSDIPAFPYEILWGERIVRSVANLTREDGSEFLALAPQVPVRTTVTEFALADANDALDDLRHGRIEGSAVILPPR